MLTPHKFGKIAVGGGLLLGAGGGALASRKGKRMHGASHGLARMLGLDVGGSLGALAGGAAGYGLGRGGMAAAEAMGATPKLNPDGAHNAGLITALALGVPGMAYGAYKGWGAGAHMANKITGEKAPWETNPEDDEPEETTNVKKAKQAMNLIQFGASMAKVAADPRMMAQEGAGPGPSQNTAFVGGQMANLRPEYDPAAEYAASPAGMKWRKDRHQQQQSAFANQLFSAKQRLDGNASDARDSNMLAAGSALIPHIGNAVGQPMLGQAAGMAGTALGALGANKATNLDRPVLQQEFNNQLENYNSVTPPNQRMPLGKSGSAFAFGAKVAQVTGMTFDPDHPNVKKLKQQHPNNWQQIMAESQGLSRADQAKPVSGKQAQSACTPCAMPNSPANKKHMTGASPAVLEAGQKSEEIGKPPVTETEHSEAEAKQPEEGAKSAYAFGYAMGR